MGQSGQQNPRTGSGSVTSKDVAARAGVSVASVCRVFDKKWKGRVSAKLEQKVLSAAQELGYHPNALARGLISKRSGIIGVVMSEEFNSFYFDLFCRMTNLIQELGMRVMVFNAAAYRDLQDIFNCFLSYQVDGIIITAASLAAGFESLKGDTPFPAPVILVNVYRHSTAWPSVICDNRRGTREMARYLYDMGGREFLFLSAFKSQYYDVEERLEGFRSGLEACGPPTACTLNTATTPMNRAGRLPAGSSPGKSGPTPCSAPAPGWRWVIWTPPVIPLACTFPPTSTSPPTTT